MIQCKLLIHLSLTIFGLHYVTGAQKTVLCYISSWAVYRQGQGKFTIEDDVDPNLCTHLVYNVMGIDTNTSTIISRDVYNDFEGFGQLRDFSKLRAYAPNLKLMISVGGWAEGSVKFSEIAASTAKRTTFVNSIFDFLKKYDLDGVDVTWQFPTDRGGIPEDKRNFVSLLKELNDKIKTEDKILTVNLCAKRYVIDPGYDLKAISQNVDFMGIMSYEYSGPWEKKTGINSPLAAANEFSTTFSVDYMIKNGAAPEKLLLGIPTYGHTFNVVEIPEDGKYIGQPSDMGFISPWTREQGFISYKEVCYELKTTSGWKEMWDDATTTPYAVNQKKFISYDNVRSNLEKAKLVNLKKLAGVAIQTLDTDDFNGICSEQKYPLVTAVKHLLAGGTIKDKPTVIRNATIISHPYG